MGETQHTCPSEGCCTAPPEPAADFRTRTIAGDKGQLKKCYRVGHDKHETHQVQYPTPVHAALKTGGKLLVPVLQRVSVCPPPPTSWYTPEGQMAGSP